ncbi:hypothetical protein ACFL6A_04755 [bacterium]
MTSNSSKPKRTNQSIFFVMGCIWIGLALFGLIFDPGKRLIIISQLVVGCISFILYFAAKYHSMKK